MPSLSCIALLVASYCALMLARRHGFALLLVAIAIGLYRLAF